ncbi:MULTISPECIES: ribonuclease J [Acidobacterium]|uniref:Ribonuclease J n=1 Tax=Acidobacterium capsulatum (strain ATCC 51196 / DSM 11244 / BCRC 80197 / JCM 7670 / NBRC 15755 / NCIMB 13165 / 161) TaxID=240015 RepID=C1F660_ACIC5|nr:MULTISPECIES: ribonuclease J [Acidobacterium]ACO32187.1 metallo-beta-lactamase family protein [Acidobacterium capsulatum ATCC 51196]HCT60857.1 ribonuclease J [Acidobacterium sp.]
MTNGKLQIIPLGGLGEFGMNCMALRWQDDIVVIDAGLMFPESELLGVDIVVPDITYLIENKEHVRGILLTHGHEDHIGGLPWILSELNVPVYGTEFTLAYVEGKLEEHKMLDETELIEMMPGGRFTLGPFTIEPIRVTHSLVDCVALAIETPVGVVVHTGDFKIDLSPPDGKAFDLHKFAEYGKRGVLLLLQDSTNVDRQGYTPSEWSVKPRLDEIFSRTKKKLFFSCFSSSIYRMRIAMDLAFHHGRKVAVIGRSMVESSEIAQDLGYLDIPNGLLIHPGQIADHAPENVMVLISGTQGEPMSALSRAAVDNHKHARIAPGDTVLLSSRVIPGNEKSIYRVIDHLYRRDAHVIFDDGHAGLIHVSGHASQEEQRLMINLLRPKFFIPVHGDYRHLKKHAEIAQSMGVVDLAMVIEDGDVVELTRDDIRKTGTVTAGRVCIDSGSTADVVEDLVIRDRRHLSEDGFVIPILTINKLTGMVERQPEVISRGFVGGDPELIETARQVVARTLEESSAEEKADYGVIKEKIRIDLKRYIQKNTSRRPLIMPVILEI